MSFTHEVDLAQGVLRLLWAGTDPLAFGHPGVSTAEVVLRHSYASPTTLSGTVRDPQTIEVQLPANWPSGWWDVKLTVTDKITQTPRVYELADLVFGDVRRAVLGLDAPLPLTVRFGEHVRLRLVEPVGRSLAQIGVTPERLQPRLLRADGGFASGATVGSIAEQTITFMLGPRYSTYDPSQPEHALDPGFLSSGPLYVAPRDLPLFTVLPVQVAKSAIETVVAQLVTAVPAAPALAPGAPAVWRVLGRARHELTPPLGMTAAVFSEVLRLLYDSGATVQARCRLSLHGTVDALGAGPAAQRTETVSSISAVPGFAYAADFGLLRPRVIRHGPAAPGTQDGTTARLDVALTATFSDPAVFTGTVTVPVPAASVPGLVQLPLAVPAVALLTDGRYDRDYQIPSGAALVLLPDSGVSTLSTSANGPAARNPVELVAKALDVLGQALPKLVPVFPGLPGSKDIVGNPTPIRQLADWLRSTPNLTVLGHPSVTNLSQLGGGHPNWEDVASTVFLVALPGSQRTLRLFSERTTSTSSSAYLDLRVPAGHLIGSLWTLHESLFQAGYGPRVPYRTVTEPNPKAQCDEAKTRADRKDMPWYLGTGYSFGNVVSAYSWI